MVSPLPAVDARSFARAWSPLSVEHPERLPADRRLLTTEDHVAVRSGGTAMRGRCCVLVVLARPAEPTRVGFIASKRGVGGSVERNRARRRLREIVRRRWPRIVATGYWLEFIALAPVLTAGHELLATEVEGLLAAAGALRPLVAGD
jgi:ribonuclease P protein component